MRERVLDSMRAAQDLQRAACPDACCDVGPERLLYIVAVWWYVSMTYLCAQFPTDSPCLVIPSELIEAANIATRGQFRDHRSMIWPCQTTD